MEPAEKVYDSLSERESNSREEYKRLDEEAED
jgi:hypothetical protein